MIYPQQWTNRRPGILIPVFFLCLFPSKLSGQPTWQESAVAGLGGAYVARPGYFTARHNQAGLGWIEQHSVSLLHSKPFIIKDLGVSALSAQLKVAEGVFGATIASFGLTGLRHTSSWISYGMKLNPAISAGIGFHFWTWSIPEKRLHHPGISFALGIQTRINQRWILGAHVYHPHSWTGGNTNVTGQPMVISAGISCALFQKGLCYLEFHMKPRGRIEVSSGMEWIFNDRLGLLLGMHNGPFTLSAGVSTNQNKWILHVAFQYLTDSGTIPQASLHHAW